MQDYACASEDLPAAPLSARASADLSVFQRLYGRADSDAGQKRADAVFRLPKPATASTHPIKAIVNFGRAMKG
jgi:hypothetical protein